MGSGLKGHDGQRGRHGLKELQDAERILNDQPDFVQV